MSEEIYQEIVRKINEFAVSFVVSLDHYRLSEQGLGDLDKEFSAWMAEMLELENKYSEAVKNEEQNNG